ncbi:hypothetical protein ACE6H2_022963 [Prunus campanulata]
MKIDSLDFDLPLDFVDFIFCMELCLFSSCGFTPFLGVPLTVVGVRKKKIFWVLLLLQKITSFFLLLMEEVSCAQSQWGIHLWAHLTRIFSLPMKSPEFH